jgi:hypothetical protein
VSVTSDDSTLPKSIQRYRKGDDRCSDTSQMKRRYSDTHITQDDEDMPRMFKFASWAGAVLLYALLSLVHARAAGEDLKRIAVLDFDLVDDQQALAPASVEYERLRAIRDQLERELVARRLYVPVDRARAVDLIEKYRAATALYRCNGCELEIGRSLRADRVLVGWVQKVSNLILNINIQIEDVSTGAVVLRKSVDLRGNTDETWSRGVSYLVRAMSEDGRGNR